MILPENGAVVVIDDQPNEALPIVQTLSRNGIATHYFKGNSEKDIPLQPLSGIRLVFLDLQLIDSHDEHQLAQHGFNTLKKIIDSNNGPYLLVLWSKNKEKYKKDFINLLPTCPHLIPVSIIEFDKRSCLKETKTPLLDVEGFSNELLDRVRGVVDDEDAVLLKDTVSALIMETSETRFEAHEETLQIIETSISKSLEKAGVFHLFVIWENLLNRAGSKTVQDIASTIPVNEHWEENMRDVLERMAKARVGKNEYHSSIMLREAVLTCNQSFSDRLETELKTFKIPEYISLDKTFLYKAGDITNPLVLEIINNNGQERLQVRKLNDDQPILGPANFSGLLKSLNNVSDETDRLIINELLINYLSVSPKLNTALHIEQSPSEETVPGSIFYVNLSEDRRNKLLESYLFVKDGNNVPLGQKTFDVSDPIIDKFQFIELEVSPICDWAQSKWKKSRWLAGLIYPAEIPQNLIRQNDHYYHVAPAFRLNGIDYKLVFDCHLLKSIDLDEAKNREIKLRIKRDLLLDIIAKVSAHVNRPGISFVS
jgi:hypothetical protein